MDSKSQNILKKALEKNRDTIRIVLIELASYPDILKED